MFPSFRQAVITGCCVHICACPPRPKCASTKKWSWCYWRRKFECVIIIIMIIINVPVKTLKNCVKITQGNDENLTSLSCLDQHEPYTSV